MNATKTKKTKVDELRPPAEIRENTKLRRAWLAEQLAAVNAGPDFEGRIVGNGSYQVVSVYSVVEVAGRLRHRGHCQFCGNSQVVDGGVMVLHGYSRPGIGYVFNECPAVKYPPLELKQNLTEGYLAEAVKTSAAINASLEKAKIEHAAALSARFGGDSDNREPDAYSTRPHAPGRKGTDEQIAGYRAAMKVWAARFPLTARLVKAEENEANLSNAAWRTKQQVDHFTLLLSWRLLGQALIEEVVV